MKKISLLICIVTAVVCSLYGQRHVFRRASSSQTPKIAQSPEQDSKRQSSSKRYARLPGTDKKQIIIFSSNGGGGHTAVSGGLIDYLGDRYAVSVTNALRTVYSAVDSLGTLTFGRVAGEDLYNFFLRCGWTNTIKRYSDVGGSYFGWRHEGLVQLTLDYFSEAKPDLVISVIGFINAPLLEACEKLGIPLLILTNDLDSTNYVIGMHPPYYKKLRYAIPFDDKELREKIGGAAIPEDQIVVTGFPLRPQFFAPKDVDKLKKEFEIPPSKPVVMIFMGGAGSQASYRYVRSLARLKMPMHIIACLGRNERLQRNIRKIMLPEGVTISTFGFTRRIADLMAVSDLLITKPGPNSLCEGLASRVPMLLDMSQGIIWWEKLNCDFMIKHGFAEALEEHTSLEQILPKYLKDRTYTESIKKKMSVFKGNRFDKMIMPLVDQMTSSK